MPEFQRNFVWTPTGVKDLVESLYLDYPIGALLLWYPPTDDSPPPAKTDDSRKTPLDRIDAAMGAMGQRLYVEAGERSSD